VTPYGLSIKRSEIGFVFQRKLRAQWLMLLKFSRQLTLSQAHARTATVFANEFNAT
jgi:hypothetical protein